MTYRGSEPGYQSRDAIPQFGGYQGLGGRYGVGIAADQVAGSRRADGEGLSDHLGDAFRLTHETGKRLEQRLDPVVPGLVVRPGMVGDVFPKLLPDCLLYTSDAADDLLCVDLGGRRI